MFYFHKVVYVQYLGEVDIFHTRVNKFLPLYNSAKIIKSIEIFQSYDHKCTATFLWFTVYNSTAYRLSNVRERFFFLIIFTFSTRYWRFYSLMNVFTPMQNAASGGPPTPTMARSNAEMVQRRHQLQFAHRQPTVYSPGYRMHYY